MLKKILWATTACMVLSLAPCPAFCADNSTAVTTSTSIVSGVGGINADMLKKFSASKPYDGKINAVSAQNLNDLSEKRSVLQSKDKFFSTKIDTGAVSDQKRSGRCWLFAALGMLSPKVVEKYGVADFEFSQNYNTFYDKLEKANMFYEMMIKYADRDIMDRNLRIWLKDPISDGGHWTYASDIIEKYGVVPNYAMAETVHSNNTTTMNYVLEGLLRKHAAEIRDLAKQGKSVDELRQVKEKDLSEVYSLLSMCLGEPPQKFNLRFETKKDKKITESKMVTPVEFYKSLGVNLKDYISIFSNPAWNYNEYYVIENNRNMYDSKDLPMINIEMDKFKEAAKASIKAGEPVWFAADASHDMDRKLGVMYEDLYDYSSLLGINTKMPKRERYLYGSSIANHAMLVTGYDEVNGKITKWCVKNSWGKTPGDSGYFTMYDNWVDDNVYQFIVNKKYLSKDVLDLLNKTPIVLPEYDLMRENLNK